MRLRKIEHQIQLFKSSQQHKDISPNIKHHLPIRTIKAACFNKPNLGESNYKQVPNPEGYLNPVDFSFSFTGRISIVAEGLYLNSGWRCAISTTSSSLSA